ncbi:hypothetical protein [Psittacicella hinzii]|uniref:Uncharacterized protein n=1 Tax=Psittacicella hinzii TaxID=2028575 RepID=A0A3A1YE71_9GAMM|nr:hypothetical protein [Psittacicella hinzii]RIY35851.1 hypothetical protein CKF58_06455 [Psittacicella hinzii]
MLVSNSDVFYGKAFCSFISTIMYEILEKDISKIENEIDAYIETTVANFLQYLIDVNADEFRVSKDNEFLAIKKFYQVLKHNFETVKC